MTHNHLFSPERFYGKQACMYVPPHFIRVKAQPTILLPLPCEVNIYRYKHNISKSQINTIYVNH